MSAALERYKELCPNDPLDDLTDEDKADFSFTDVSLSAVRVDWPTVMVKSGVVESKTAAKRLITAGALHVDGERVEEIRTTEIFGCGQPTSVLVKVGRKMMRLEWTAK